MVRMNTLENVLLFSFHNRISLLWNLQFVALSSTNSSWRESWYFYFVLLLLWLFWTWIFVFSTFCKSCSSSSLWVSGSPKNLFPLSSSFFSPLFTLSLLTHTWNPGWPLNHPHYRQNSESTQWSEGYNILLQQAENNHIPTGSSFLQDSR